MSNNNRKSEVDWIRTLALIGICVVNVPFMGLPLSAQLAVPETLIDQVALFAVEMLFQGKFFLLFSFVFGWGFHVQAASAAKSGGGHARRHFLRMGGLAVIGIAHALLVFVGDILVLYAVLGSLLWFVRTQSPIVLTRLALAMVPLAALSLLIVVSMVGDGNIDAETTTGLAGGYGEATLYRWSQWPETATFIALFNGPLAFAAFCLGLAAAKIGFFDRGNHVFERLSAAVPWLLLPALALNAFYAAMLSGLLADIPEVWQIIAFTSLSVGGPLLSLIYLVAIIHCARAVKVPSIGLAAGRSSLTGYVTDGVIAGAVFGAYGLGWFGGFGHAGLFGLAIAIAMFGIVLAMVWELFSKRGPLEAVLRAITRIGRPEKVVA